MKAYIHIGLPKTGSTSIQKSLFQGSKKLLKDGVLYPDLDNIQHLGIVPLFLASPENFGKVRKLGLNRQEALQWASAQQAELDRQIERSRADCCILSSEFFSKLESVDEVANFKAFLDDRFEQYQIVAYVREPGSLFCSSLNQFIKSGNSSFREYPTPQTFNSRNRERLQRYVDCFGSERMDVVKFSRDYLYEGDVVRDFLKRAQFSGSIDVVNGNQSLPGAILATMVTLNRHIPKWVDGQLNPNWSQLRSRLIRLVEEDSQLASLPPLRIEKEAWRHLIARNHRDESQWLDDTFFAGKTVFSAPSPEVDETFQQQDYEQWLNSYLSEGLFSQIVWQMLEQGISEERELRNTIAKLENSSLVDSSTADSFERGNTSSRISSELKAPFVRQISAAIARVQSSIRKLTGHNSSGGR